MKKLIILNIAALLCVLGFCACNEKVDTPEYIASNVAVDTFFIQKDDNILENLDNVFFTIDLENGKIFNADSLPFGTKVNKLIPVIKLKQGASAATLTVKTAAGTDTVHDYIKNHTDSIDFSNGPVILSVTSLDEKVTKKYTINVNVHQVKADSLTWSRTERRALPSQFDIPARQHTAATAKAAYCLTLNAAGQASMAVAANPGDANWDIYSVTLPAEADIKSFTATEDALYILTPASMWKSTDGGRSWSDTQQAWSHIYGAYGQCVLGAFKKDGNWYTADYPATAGTAPILPGMPVSGTSAPVAFSFPLVQTAQLLTVGGYDKDGKAINTTWGYDGREWACLSAQPLPKALGNMCLVPFFTFQVNSLWTVTDYACLLAFGGNNDSEINRTVYMSTDYGLTWAEAPASVQFPEEIPAMISSQAYVFTSTIHAPKAARWRAVGGRATEPVTQWDCPYIYIFGGESQDGVTYNTIWRGTINRLSFKPII